MPLSGQFVDTEAQTCELLRIRVHPPITGDRMSRARVDERGRPQRFAGRLPHIPIVTEEPREPSWPQYYPHYYIIPIENNTSMPVKKTNIFRLFIMFLENMVHSMQPCSVAHA